jgi:HEXXH motif-containing protein
MSAERQVTLERLKAAQCGIASTGEHLLEFVKVFNKVVIPQKDLDTPSIICSGSSGQYIGRSVITNPHIWNVDEVDIAEALVHEAIHALLYMQEQKKAWVLDDDLYNQTVRTVSPWTGNLLPLRSYLQAAFVWFGLLHFWSQAMIVSTFERARIRQRMTRAASGFLSKPLDQQICDYTDRICPILLKTVCYMQEEVIRAFGD